MKKLPLARNENIVVQDLKTEVLIYDETIDKAYCLNETCGIVFNACDGAQTFEDLKRRYKYTDDLIHLALGELAAKNLLSEAAPDHFGNLTRREVVRRVGFACAVALPVVVGITAPSAARASSAGFCRDSTTGTIQLCRCDEATGAALEACRASGVNACPSGCTCQRTVENTAPGQCIIGLR